MARHRLLQPPLFTRHLLVPTVKEGSRVGGGRRGRTGDGLQQGQERPERGDERPGEETH